MTTPLLAEQLDLDAAAFALSDRAAKRLDQGLVLGEDD
jgi:hypothetical protein